MSAMPDQPTEFSTSPASAEAIFAAHEGGKLAVHGSSRLQDAADLAMLYTPGVAAVSSAIAEDPSLADRYTWRRNTVAVITDGTAVLGLGNIGPLAALPVMEGKAVLFQHFAGVDAVPVCLETGTVEELVEAIVRMAPTYGGINLEDIAAPRCFEIERQLQERLDIPVFHDDQHGTAIVALAALHNAVTVVGKDPADLTVVVSGAGAAGVAVAKILVSAGVGQGAGEVIVVDSSGIIGEHRANLPEHKAELARLTNRRGREGGIGQALIAADVLIGVSGGTIAEAHLAQMADDAIIFGLANPDPEVHPDIARKYATVVATGRSDFPNQINNVLAFPGIFRGALDAGARRITEPMKHAAARAIAELVAEPTADYVIPSAFDDRVAPAVSAAVAAVAAADRRNRLTAVTE